jgi:hypothetical protein
MRSISLLLLIAVALVGRTSVHGFSVSTKTARTYSIRRRSYCANFALQAAPEDGDSKQEDKLAQLGYSSDDIGRSRKENDKEQQSVNVNLLPDIDPLTVTALGFALIAFNFFVLGNMGDGGIGGVVARIMNFFDQLD